MFGEDGSKVRNAQYHLFSSPHIISRSRRQHGGIRSPKQTHSVHVIFFIKKMYRKRFEENYIS